jgi:hypothetical protein
MKAVSITILLLFLFLLLAQATSGLAEPEYSNIYLPLVMNGGWTYSGQALVIDHLNTDISKIPDRWIDAAQSLAIAYAHTSHGSQILTGLQWLETQDPRYNIDIRYNLDDFSSTSDPTALRLYDGNNVPGNSYITPDLYWSTSSGQDYTRSVVQTGLFTVSVWTWCGQQSTNSAATVDQYLNTLDQFEQEFPGVRFMYFTGHTDGNYSGSRLLENNQLVRDYALANQKILFDFADFESYDPSGNYYPNASDSCSWCQSYCTDHPDMCVNLDQMSDCAHPHKLQCKLKAQAFWWLAARLAGWDGVSQ